MVITCLLLVHQPCHLFVHCGVLYQSVRANRSCQLAVNDGLEMASDGKLSMQRLPTFCQLTAVRMESPTTNDMAFQDRNQLKAYCAMMTVL